MGDNLADNGDNLAGAQGNQNEAPTLAALPGATYAQQHFAQNHVLQEQLKKFWADMMTEVEKVGTDPAEFKSQQLPLARIKKIMKSDEDVRMISAEAPVLFAKACEFFIQEMTLRAWNAAEEHKRRTLQRGDIATAISRTEVWDFLLDTVPLEGEAAAAVAAAGAAPAGAEEAPASTAPTAAAAATAAAVPPPMPMGMFQGQFIPPMNSGMPPPGMIPPGMPLMYPGAMAPPPGIFMPQPGQPGAPQFGAPQVQAMQVPQQQPQQGTGTGEDCK